MGKTNIFISYRREDSKHAAGRIHDKLIQHFHEESVYIDIDHIDIGENYLKAIQETLKVCDVCLVVIGNEWLNSRLANPKDLVRREIATALKNDIIVMPILLDGATMPKPEDLPKDLIDLTNRSVIKVKHERFSSDADYLIKSIKKSVNITKKNRHEKLEESSNKPLLEGNSDLTYLDTLIPQRKDKTNIFINYRKEDSKHAAGRIHDKLIQHFHEESVYIDIDYIDIDHIDIGENYLKAIQETLKVCDVCLVVIGNEWLKKDSQGKSQLTYPNDLVRREISVALNNNIMVLPILLDGATMPKPEDLPQNLIDLANRNAVKVDHERFSSDIDYLVRSIKRSFNLTRKLKHAKLKESRNKPPLEDNEDDIYLNTFSNITEITFRTSVNQIHFELVGLEPNKLRGSNTTFELTPGKYSFYINYYSKSAPSISGSTYISRGKSPNWEGDLNSGKYLFEYGFEHDTINSFINFLKIFIPLSSTNETIYLKQISYEPWTKLNST